MTPADVTYASEHLDATEAKDEMTSLGTSTYKKNQSRHEILNELANFGVNTKELSALSIDGLDNLLNGLKGLMSTQDKAKKPGRPRMNPDNMPVLTNKDKAILRLLSESKGRVSSLRISRELDIPLSTIQRRRKRLQDIAIESNYFIRADKLGWRTAMLHISSTSGRTEAIGREILDMSDQVASATRTVGDNSFDLRIEVIFRTIDDLTAIIDKIKAMTGVGNVIWCESLKVIGKNDINKKIIDSTA